MKQIALVLLGLILSGCTTTTVNPVQGKGGDSVCIVDNPAVRREVIDAYRSKLVVNGYQVKVVSSKPEGADCMYLSTYTASWGFHWGPYLSYARIDVYKGEALIGNAMYKAPYASPAKHIHSIPKIEELVDGLFPKRL